MPAPNKHLVLAAMVFAVAMIFIDQTIVALAIPSLQEDLHLTSTGAQWIVNGYLLALSAFFALGGKVADIVGRRRMVLIGVAGFALCSALCGLTPTGSIGQTWIIVFRVLQGVSAAFLFPAALAIVVATYPVNERGKALAIFFSVSGGLTSVGPILGGYLTQWTWRAIFWINLPVAAIAIVLTLIAKPREEKAPAPIDVRGAALVIAGMSLSVLGLQQAGVWGWDSPATWGCLVVGVALLAAFARHTWRADEPLVPMRLFAGRGFTVDNVILFLLSVCFVPLFFFASLYAQVALGDDATQAGLFLLVFFAGFTIGAQIGGRILDARGARPAVVIGCAISAVGFFLWASKLDDLSFSSQWFYLVLTGVGMGFTLGPSSTDAVNRAARTSYGAVTGLTQTVRNFAGSLGLAVLGSILITQNVAKIVPTLTQAGVPDDRAHAIARGISGGGAAQSAGKASASVLHAIQLDFAHSTQVVIYAMAALMALGFVVAVAAMPSGTAAQQQAVAVEPDPAPAPS